MIENIISQLPSLFLNRIKEYLSNDEYKQFLASLNQNEKKGLILDINKLNNNELLNDIINTLNLNFYYNNNNYNYYFFDESNFKNNKSIGNQIYHHQGLYYVQEPSASLVIKDTIINDGDTILDLCAAPGGKSIDCLFNNKNGYIVSNDIDIKRAKIISSNIERLGFSNSIITNNNPIIFQNIYPNYFDIVILDAPCSGEGMMRKNNIARSQWNINLIEKMSNIQKKLIDVAYECTNNNGTIVYSTCTFAKEEDEEIIDYIIKKHKSIEIIKSNKLFFHNNIGEGQFYTILKKHDNNIQTTTINNQKNKIINLKNKNSKIYKDFIKLFESVIDYNINGDANIDIILLNNRIYAINKNIPLHFINNLNILRIGIELAEIKNNNIYLSHSITHSLFSKYFKNIIDLSEEDSFRYLKGESFNINSKYNSFALTTYKNIPLGLCKTVNGMLKNHYPKGLRILN